MAKSEREKVSNGHGQIYVEHGDLTVVHSALMGI